MEIRTKLITDLPLSEVLEGFEIFPVSQFGVAKKASTQDIISFTKKQNYATWVYKASTNLETVDLSSKYIKLYNSSQTDNSFPEFFIGEVGIQTSTGEISSLSGFNFHYNSNTDRFVFVSYLSTDASNRSLTSYYIDSNAYMYITNLSTSNTLSARNIYVTDQITISANSNNDALYIVQSGQGNAIEVFDEINDITPFVVNASGNVGIKTPNPIIDLTIQGNVSASQTLSARNIHVLDRVGIATSDPRETLTVSGSISARTIIYDGRSNSDRWFETFTNYSAGSANEARAVSFVNNNSANISQVNSTVNNTSSNWNSVYSNWNSVSVLDLNVRSYVVSNSSNFSDSITIYNTASGTYATMAYTNRGFLPLSGGEVSSGVVRISGATTFGSDVTIVGRLCANLLTVLKTESIPITAATLSVQGSGSFGGAFNVGGEARFNDDLIVTGFANVSSTVTADGIITSRQFLQDLNGTSRDWNSVYSNWNSVSVLDLNVRSFVVNNSTNSLNVNTTVNTTSSNWNSVYNTWNLNSAFDLSARTFVNNNSTNILNVNTVVNNNSANWNQAYTTWNPLSTITTGTTTFVSQNSVRSLNVNTYVTTTSGSIILNNGNNGPITIGTINAQDLSLESNNQTRITVKSGGNVGINELNPNSKLHVTSNDDSDAIYISATSNGDGLHIVTTSNGAGLRIEDELNDTTQFIVDNQGRVGIGASPTTQLYLNSNGSSFTTPANNDVACIHLNNSSTMSTGHSVVGVRTVSGDPFISYDINGVIGWSTGIDNSDSDSFKISNWWSDVGTNTRVTILVDGRTGINTNSPNERLTVNGNISSNAIIYDARGDSIRWNNAFTSVSPNSGNWNSAYSSFFNLSGAIGDGLTEFQESSARYNRVSTRVEMTSSNWNSVYTTFQSNSGKYNSDRGVIPNLAAGTTTITVPNHTLGAMDVYLNGVKLINGTDFTETETSITLSEPTKYANYALEYVVYGAYNVANAVAKTGDVMSGALTVPSLTITNSALRSNLTGNTTGVHVGSVFGRSSDHITTQNLMVSSNILVTGEITTIGRKKPIGWGGGLTTWDVFAEGSVGTGPAGALSALMNNQGNAYFLGNISIGTPNAAARLHLRESNIGVAPRIFISSPQDVQLMYSTDREGRIGWSFGQDATDGDKFKIANWFSNLQSNTRVTVDNQGRMGVGTTSPNQRLTVVGNISATQDIVTSGQFIGDGGGLYNIDRERKFYSFSSDENYVGGSPNYRINAFLSEDRRLYLTGYAYGTFTGLGESTENEYVRAGFYETPIDGFNSGEFIEKYYMGPRQMYVLTNQRNLFSIGMNSRGELGIGNTTNQNYWTKVTTINDIIYFSCSNGLPYSYWNGTYGHCHAITNNGRLYSWGYNAYGTLGTGDTTDRTIPTWINVGAIAGKTITKAIVIGDESNAYGSSFCIDNQRNVYATGYQIRGHFGLNDTVQRNSYVLIPNIKADKILGVGYQGQVTIGILDGTTLYTAGANDYGQLGIPAATTSRSTFAIALNNVKDFAVGSFRAGTFMALMTDNTIRTWGGNNFGNLGHNGTTNTHVPTVPTGFAGKTFQKVAVVAGSWESWAASGVTCYALDTEGFMWAAGYNGYGQLGDGTVTNSSVFKKMRLPQSVRIKDFNTWGFSNGTGITMISTTGLIYGCGYNEQSCVGLNIGTNTTARITVPRRLTIN